jgi:murein L,D-transpeptidase YafK
MNTLIVVLLLIFSSFASPKAGFKATQLKFPRVKEAFNEKGKTLSKLYEKSNLKINNAHIFLRVFKEEDELELWAKNAGASKFTKIKTFKVCAKSGSIGPKSRAGDGQVPEGFYQIDRFNPKSNYHLSLGINYPNKADKIRAGFYPTGGDIFIHGECVTIGCVPLTNEYIQELYIAAVEAKNCMQKVIQVEIYPCHLSKDNLNKIKKQYAKQPEYIKVWNALQKGYEHFEKNHMPVKYSIDAKGNYVF